MIPEEIRELIKRHASDPDDMVIAEAEVYRMLSLNVDRGEKRRLIRTVLETLFPDVGEEELEEALLAV